MKSVLLNILTRSKLIAKWYYGRKKKWLNKQYNGQTREQVFSRIYDKNEWGEGREEFYSGYGSRETSMYLPYCECIKGFISSHDIASIVDLGCGDFFVGKKITNEGINYLGIDIVDKMIEYNQKNYGNEYTSFECLDIVRDELPDADLCLVREVLQHLSNADIAIVLRKLMKYQYVIITCHNTKKENALKYNDDIPAGAGTRTVLRSGVYLDEEPYKIPITKLLSIERENNEELTTWLVDTCAILDSGRG